MDMKWDVSQWIHVVFSAAQLYLGPKEANFKISVILRREKYDDVGGTDV